MRVIKFRVWNNVQKCFVEFLNNGDKPLLDLQGNIIKVASFDSEIVGQTIEFEETKPTEDFLILEQFTGLVDKNGIEIYEGDIVIDKWIRNEIKYSSKYGCFFVGDMTVHSALKYGHKFEVIGNLHQNPELLK